MIFHLYNLLLNQVVPSLTDSQPPAAADSGTQKNNTQYENITVIHCESL